MSKKIWRGRSHTPHGRIIPRVEPVYDSTDNATVVPDSACFPVREAMAFIKRAEELGRGWFHVSKESVAAEEWNAMGDAFDKYLAAVDKMKRRAGK